jgi:hypothetical protein
MTKPDTTKGTKGTAATEASTTATPATAPEQPTTTVVAASNVEGERERLQKQAGSLPKLSDAAKTALEGTKRLIEADFNGLLAWMRFESRRRWIESESSRLQPGQRVLIKGGKDRHVGKEGVCIIVRKARAFVQVPGYQSPVYCLISDLERVS